MVIWMIVAVVSCGITLWILVGGQNFLRRGAGPLAPPAGAGAADYYYYYYYSLRLGQ